MKLTLALVQKLQRLANGETIPASQLRGEWVDELIQEQILQPETHGTKRSYRVDNVTAFLLALTKYHEALADLDKAEQLFAGHTPCSKDRRKPRYTHSPARREICTRRLII